MGCFFCCWSNEGRSARVAGPFTGRKQIGTPLALTLMSKKTSKKKAKMRRSKANHGKRPNMGR